MEIIWHDIPDTHYEVCTDGTVRNKRTNKILARTYDKNGYVRYCLWYISLKKVRYVPAHRLVAEAFLPNPDNLPQINHKDENPRNPRLDNLEWCTAQYNCNYGRHQANQSAALKGRVPGMQGKTHSTETRQRMSEWQRQHNPMRGRTHTAESLERMREAHLGHLHTEETKAKMSKPVQCVETGIVYIGATDAAQKTGINLSSITRVCRGDYATAGGFHWTYFDSTETMQ